ncbi:MAG: Wzz/FepE/Etk N-terminal domain-containing protein, partial [Saprospiraceae bacterium]
MDIAYLLRILARRKWLILSAMLAAAVVTFLLIARKPERYKATVIVSTGIVNYKGLNADNSDAFVQQFQIENAFANLIEYAQSRSAIKLLSIDMLR